MRIFGSLIKAIVLAIPFYFLWNYLAPIYLPQAPAQYLDIPFWHITGIFMVVHILKLVVFPSRGWKGRHYMGACGFNKFQKFGRGRWGRRGFWTENYRHQA